MASFGSVAANDANWGSKITGVTDGGDPTAGNIGEAMSSGILISAGLSLTTATPLNVASISLTAGDWDVSGEVVFDFTSATISGDSIAGISGTTATLNGDIPDAYSGLRLTTTTCKTSIALPPQRVNIVGTLSRFLVAQATFSAGSAKASGTIRARRVR